MNQNTNLKNKDFLLSKLNLWWFKMTNYGKKVTINSGVLNGLQFLDLLKGNENLGYFRGYFSVDTKYFENFNSRRADIYYTSLKIKKLTFFFSTPLTTQL